MSQSSTNALEYLATIAATQASVVGSTSTLIIPENTIKVPYKSKCIQKGQFDPDGINYLEDNSKQQFDDLEALAKSGDPEAMFDLATCLRFGIGYDATGKRCGFEYARSFEIVKAIVEKFQLPVACWALGDYFVNVEISTFLTFQSKDQSEIMKIRIENAYKLFKQATQPKYNTKGEKTFPGLATAYYEINNLYRDYPEILAKLSLSPPINMTPNQDKSTSFTYDEERIACKTAAKLGYDVAQYDYANECTDLNEKRKFLELAAKNGHKEAQEALEKMNQGSLLVKKQFEELLAKLKHLLSTSLNIPPQNALTNKSKPGKAPVARNPEQNGYVSALLSNGQYTYRHGSSLLKNKTASEIKRMHDDNSSQALFDRGICHRFGFCGYMEDANEAYRYIQQSAEKGFSAAQWILGEMLIQNNEGIRAFETLQEEHRHLKAFEFFCQAAEPREGNPPLAVVFNAIAQLLHNSEAFSFFPLQERTQYIQSLLQIAKSLGDPLASTYMQTLKIKTPDQNPKKQNYPSDSKKTGVVFDLTEEEDSMSSGQVIFRIESKKNNNNSSSSSSSSNNNTSNGDNSNNTSNSASASITTSSSNGHSHPVNGINGTHKKLNDFSMEDDLPLVLEHNKNNRDKLNEQRALCQAESDKWDTSFHKLNGELAQGAMKSTEMQTLMKQHISLQLKWTEAESKLVDEWNAINKEKKAHIEACLVAVGSANAKSTPIQQLPALQKTSNSQTLTHAFTWVDQKSPQLSGVKRKQPEGVDAAPMIPLDLETDRMERAAKKARGGERT